jgi:succinoglycan biosynthesis transport protein ExoP
MDENIRTLTDHFNILRRRKGVFLGSTLALLIVTLGIVLVLPPVYRSTATVLIEQQDIPEELVRSTVKSYADERIQLFGKRVMTSANLQAIIEKYNLYAEARKKQPPEIIHNQMRNDIDLETVSTDVKNRESNQGRKAEIAFTISYESRSPELARDVAAELVSLFFLENRKTRAKLASETATFLAQNSEDLGNRLSELDEKLAEFKEKNIWSLPENSELNLRLLDRAERELAQVDLQRQAVQQRRIHLHSELRRLNPMTPLYSESGERILGSADRLRILLAQYSGLSGVYSPSHPDMVRMRKEIEALKTEVGRVEPDVEIYAGLMATDAELTVKRQQYSTDHPDTRKLKRTAASLKEKLSHRGNMHPMRDAVHLPPENPAYIELQAQLMAADTELHTLEEKRQELESKLATYENRLIRASEVEREYSLIKRDYSDTLAQYKDTMQKLAEARRGEAMELSRKGERLTLIEAPLYPYRAARPNRVAIFFLGFLFAIGGGLGATVLMHHLDDSIWDWKEVAGVLQAPPLALIPYIESENDARGRIGTRAWMGIALVVFFVAGLVLHLAIKPFDAL